MQTRLQAAIRGSTEIGSEGCHAFITAVATQILTATPQANIVTQV